MNGGAQTAPVEFTIDRWSTADERARLLTIIEGAKDPNKPRSVNYPFTILEIRLNSQGKGDGKIHSGAKVFLDKKGNIAVENCARQPLRFNEIKTVN
jgi:hypothetical protein